jgi:hypothetical protein
LYSVAIHADEETFTLGYSSNDNGNILGLTQLQKETKKDVNPVQILFSDKTILESLEQSTSNIYYETTSNFTIVPSPFFDHSKIKELVKGVFKQSEKESLMAIQIPEIDSHIIFTVESETISLIKSRIGHTKFSHHFAALISTYKMYYVKEDVKSVFIQFHDTKFTLSLFDGINMVHFNVFDIQSYEDVLYYVYYTMNLFDFDPITSPIHFGGSYSHSDKVNLGLQKYSKTIFHLKPEYCPELSEEKKDIFINTIFDIKCG